MHVIKLRRARHGSLGEHLAAQAIEQKIGNEQPCRSARHEMRLIRKIGDDLRQGIERQELNPSRRIQRLRADLRYDLLQSSFGARIAIRIRPTQRLTVGAERHVVHGPAVD